MYTKQQRAAAPTTTTTTTLTSNSGISRKPSFGFLSSLTSTTKAASNVTSPHGFVKAAPPAASENSAARSVSGGITSTRRLENDTNEQTRRLGHRLSNPTVYTTTLNNADTPTSHKDYTQIWPLAPTSAGHAKVAATGSIGKSSLLSRSKSAIFKPSSHTQASRSETPTPNGIPRLGRKKTNSIGDQDTYCVLSEDGMEVLAKTTETVDGETENGEVPKSEKKVKKSPSLANLLKTPSRMTLCKVPSKMKIFADTPSTSATVRTRKSSEYIGARDAPLPPLPIPSQQPPLPSIGQHTISSIAQTIATPASSKSNKSTKSLFRTALRDKTKRTVNRPNAPILPGTVAAQVEKIECLRASHNSGSTQMDADLSVSSRPAKHNWLNRITKGMTSGKSNRYKKLELSTFDSPGLGFQVQEELTRRNEIVIQPAEETSQPASPITPTPHQPERLSVAVRFSSVLHTPLTPVRGDAFTFPVQAIVASSPYSGDLHLGTSPAHAKGASLALAQSTNSRNSFIAEIGLELGEERERPKSEPVPLKGVAGATIELQSLLENFEDTFCYEHTSSHASLASTFQTSQKPSEQPISEEESEGSDMPDDLQDLIDGVLLTPNDDYTSAPSEVSSFEGNASTAHEAIALAGPYPPMPELRPSIDHTERPSIDTERPSIDSTERPSFESARPSSELDSARTSFDYGDRAEGYFGAPHKSYFYNQYSHKRNVSSQGGQSNRSSLRDYMTMERPTVGDRMLDEIDEDVPLASCANARDSFQSYASPRNSHLRVVNRTAHSSTAESSESDVMSYFGSPTPANGIRRVMTRHSIECDVGDSTRPSFDSDISRPSFDSIRPIPPSIRPDSYEQHSAQQKQNALHTQKQSTASSMFSMSSVNSSPCPRPPRRKLLMLTGNKLPRAPLKQPIFQANASGPSPEAGRVRKLKDSWEAKISPNKDGSPLSSGSSPRYVRPLPLTLGKVEVPRPQLLSNLTLHGAYVPPDTPPPSSPSASEQSYGSGQRSSMDSDRSIGRFRQAWGRKKGHRRQTSALSRCSILAEPIDEEPTTTYFDKVAEAQESTIHAAQPLIEDQRLKSFSPLVIRKRSNASLSLGLEAFQTSKQPVRESGPVIEIIEDDRDWLEIEQGQKIRWAHFCQDAVAELQKSRASYPDTDESLDILDSPNSSISSILSTPGTPVLSPEHQSEVTKFLLNSQRRYRSEYDTDTSFRGSPDVPATPELSPDNSVELSLRRRASDISPPSPSPTTESRPVLSYQPKSLVLVQKHLSQQNILAPVLAPVAVTKSTKGFKPRNTKAVSPVKVKPLSPIKKIKAVANKRTMSVYVEENTRMRQATNSFLAGRTLSTRRRDAFAAARRKLEGIGGPEEQTDRSSGTSSNDESGETAVLEAGGALESVDSSRISISRPRPARPGAVRKAQSASVRMMR